MTLYPDFLAQDSTVTALIPQCSPSHLSTESPIMTPSLTSNSSSEGVVDVITHQASSSESVVDVITHQADLHFTEASYPYFSLMHRVLPVHDDWGRRNEMKDHSNGMQKYGRIVSSSKKRSTPEDQSRGFPIFHENRKGFHGTVCCKGVAALLADCVALSCCPCAVLHLLALICVRLPIAVAQKLIVNTKDMIFSKRHPRNGRRDINLGCDLRKSWSNENSPDRYASINAKTTTGSFDIDMQNFWQAFEAGRLEFGRLSVRKDPEK